MRNEVLDSTRFLVESPKYVFINKDKLEETAQRFAKEELKIPNWELPVNLEGKTKEVIDFFFLGDSINFAYTDFSTKQKFKTMYRGTEWSGAMAMRACLKKAFEGEFPHILEGDFLRNVSEEQMKKIFEGNMQIPMLKERNDIFNEVGSVLCDKYGGHFYNLAEQSGQRLFNNGTGIVDRLVSDFPSFDDSLAYNGRLVKFYKRAQLAPATLYGRFRNQGDFVVQDIDELTVFADYVLPKGLRDLGILEYVESLADKVDHQELILRHSLEELEIRASTIHASKMLADRINEIRGNDEINALQIDYKLWSESRKQPSPHHLTYTIDY